MVVMVVVVSDVVIVERDIDVAVVAVADVVVEVTVVDVQGNSQSCGQCSRAKSPWSFPSLQLDFGILVPQPAASSTLLQRCGM